MDPWLRKNVKHLAILRLTCPFWGWFFYMTISKGCWTKNRGVKPPKWMVNFSWKTLWTNGWFGGFYTPYFRKHPKVIGDLQLIRDHLRSRRLNHLAGGFFVDPGYWVVCFYRKLPPFQPVFHMGKKVHQLPKLGMVDLPLSIGNLYNGYIDPYYIPTIGLMPILYYMEIMGV